MFFFQSLAGNPARKDAGVERKYSGLEHGVIDVPNNDREYGQHCFTAVGSPGGCYHFSREQGGYQPWIYQYYASRGHDHTAKHYPPVFEFLPVVIAPILYMSIPKAKGILH